MLWCANSNDSKSIANIQLKRKKAGSLSALLLSKCTCFGVWDELTMWHYGTLFWLWHKIYKDDVVGPNDDMMTWWHYDYTWCCPLSSLHVSALLTFIFRDFITSPERKELNYNSFVQISIFMADDYCSWIKCKGQHFAGGWLWLRSGQLLAHYTYIYERLWRDGGFSARINASWTLTSSLTYSGT